MSYCLLGHPLVPGEGTSVTVAAPPQPSLVPAPEPGDDPSDAGAPPGEVQALVPPTRPRLDHLSLIGSLARQNGAPPTGKRAGTLSRPTDPITSFAPAPRMDWGPEHSPWAGIFRLPRRAPSEVDPSEDPEVGWAREIGEPYFVDEAEVSA